MPDVSTPCEEYLAAQPQWQLIEDAAAGEYAVKSAGDVYLPRPNPQDKSKANCERFDAYVMRAVYYNATGRTLDGLLGLAFAKDPLVKSPAALDDVLANLDGAGTSCVQHMHDTLGEVLKTGRAGLLADFPKTEGTTSRAAETAGGVRPTVTYYPATAIINWRTTVIGGRAVLSLVVLAEKHREPNGAFADKSETQYRALILEGGVYRVEIWRKKKNSQTGADEYALADTANPVGGDGKTLAEIPFTFVGALNNSVGVNKAPMGDIAAINIAHYRNSADYEDSVYITGQPQFWIAGLDEAWRDHLEKTGLYMGARSVLPLPVNASAGILQAQPNTLAKEAMDAKQEQMAALGARLISADKSLKTATQQQSEDAVANSVLSLCCDNVSAAYTRALTWAAMFANAAGEVAVEIPTEFTKFTISSEDLGALVSGVQQGLIPLSDFWARLRQAGVISPEKTDAQIKEELDAMPPPGLAMPDDPAADA